MEEVKEVLGFWGYENPGLQSPILKRPTSRNLMFWATSGPQQSMSFIVDQGVFLKVLSRVELNPYTVKQRIYRMGCIEEIPVCSDDFADKFLLFSILWVKWGPSGETRDTDWLLLLILHCTRLHLNTLHYTIMHCNTLNYTAMSHCILMLPLSEWTR